MDEVSSFVSLGAMLITSEYRKSQTEFHIQRPDYGISGLKHIGEILELARAVKAETVLDYGCGKATLASGWPNPAIEPGQPMLLNYDPCISEHAELPPPCDLVYCGDVLEHVEPDCLNAVLHDLRRLTLKAVLLVICTSAAVKTLQDGRNAHLIQEGPRWWLDALDDRWEINNLFFDGRDLMIAGRPGACESENEEDMSHV